MDPTAPDLTQPQPTYILTAPTFHVPVSTFIGRTDTSPVQRQNPPPEQYAQRPAERPAERKEIQLNLPPTFDGDRKKYKKTRQAVVLYLSVN